MKSRVSSLFTLVILFFLPVFMFDAYAQVSVTNSASPITPYSVLHVHDNSASGQILQLTNTTSGYTSANYGFAVELEPNFNVKFSNKYDGHLSGISFYTKVSGINYNRLHIDNSGYVGIGTADPGYKLTVDGSLGLLETGGSSYYTVLRSANLSTNRTFTLPADYGTNGQFLTTNGSGTWSWSSGESPLIFTNGLSRSSNNVKWGGNLTGNTEISLNSSETLTFTNSGSGNITFNLAYLGDFDVQDNGSSALFVSSTGKVGIGNNNPDEEIVVGENQGAGWSIPAITVGDGTGGAMQLGNGTEKISIEGGSTWPYSRIRASDASGVGDGNIVFFVDRIGIGDNSPAAKLHVETSGSEQSGYFQGSGSGLSYVTLKSENTNTGSGVAAYFKTRGTDVTLALDQDGSGPILKCFGSNGGNEEFRMNTDGYSTWYNQNHFYTVIINPDDDAAGEIGIYNGSGTNTILMQGGELGSAYGSQISMYNGSGDRTIRLDASETGVSDGSQITLYDDSGNATIEIDGDYNGDGRVSTNELQITGGSDLAELFDITCTEKLEKGMVLVIDQDTPGKLKISEKAYDHRVAGIVSGANGISTGLIMSEEGTVADGEHLVALTGRVYCLVDAFKGSVEPGDLLTTSSTPGYAMKVKNHKRARGAIIGKAMSSLENGKGLVLVLVSLQ